MRAGSAIDAPPPQLPARSGGGDSGWVELLVAAHDIDAHLLLGRLGEAGIETTAVKERSAPGAWLLCGSDPWAPVRIFVRRLQLDDARLVLAELAWAGPPAPPVEPRAAELRRRSFVWWAAALLLGLFFTGLALDSAARAVEDCARRPRCSEASSSR